MFFCRKVSVLVLLLAFLSGCSGLPSIKDGTKKSVENKKMPFAEPAKQTVELDDESVFSMLTAEIAAHRAQFGLAQNHYLYVARLTGSVYAAKRAARIALFQNDKDKLLDAVRLWVDLAPNDVKARRAAAVAFFRQEQPEKAYQELQALLQIADAKEIDGYLGIAATFSKEANKKESLKLLQRLVTENDRPLKGEYAVAILAYAADEIAQAEVSIKRVYSAQPDNTRAALLYSQVLVYQKRLQPAVDILADAVELQPDSIALRTAYAKVLTEAEQLDEAREQFIALLKLQPGDTEVQYAIAILAIQSKRWDEAEQYLMLIHEKGERRDEMAYYLGHVAQARGNNELAVRWYSSVANEGYLADAQIRLIRLYAKMNKLDGAIAVLNTFRKQNPERVVDSYVLEAELLRDARRSLQALAVLDKQVEGSPDSIRFRYLRGMVEADLELYGKMEADFRFILNKKPDHVDALNAFGYTLADKTKRIKEAYGYINKAYQLEPDNAAILDSMGWVLYRMGKYDEAIDFLSRAFKKLPDGEIAAHLGEVLWVVGEREKATKLWQEALQNEPDSKHIKNVLKRFH